MASTKDVLENTKNDEQQAEENSVTPQISVKDPIKSVKDFFVMVSQFVSVGGDFV